MRSRHVVAARYEGLCLRIESLVPAIAPWDGVLRLRIVRIHIGRQLAIRVRDVRVMLMC